MDISLGQSPPRGDLAGRAQSIKFFVETRWPRETPTLGSFRGARARCPTPCRARWGTSAPRHEAGRRWSGRPYPKPAARAAKHLDSRVRGNDNERIKKAPASAAFLMRPSRAVERSLAARVGARRLTRSVQGASPDLCCPRARGFGFMAGCRTPFFGLRRETDSPGRSACTPASPRVGQVGPRGRASCAVQRRTSAPAVILVAAFASVVAACGAGIP